MAGPQARAIVVIEDNLAAVGAAAAQQRQQLRAVGRREDRQANAAEVQVIELRQPGAQCPAWGPASQYRAAASLRQ